MRTARTRRADFACETDAADCAATEYRLSEHAETTLREREIALEWLTSAMNDPDLTLPHEYDATLRYALKKIPAFGDRVLRVVYNATMEPPVIVTLYFDRTMQGKL